MDLAGYSVDESANHCTGEERRPESLFSCAALGRWRWREARPEITCREPGERGRGSTVGVKLRRKRGGHLGSRPAGIGKRWTGRSVAVRVQVRGHGCNSGPMSYASQRNEAPSKIRQTWVSEVEHQLSRMGPGFSAESNLIFFFFLSS